MRGAPASAGAARAGEVRVLLHVGMHKTGSSSIQRYLAAIGAGDGFRYLDLGRGPNHSGAMFAGFAGAPETYHNFRRRNLSPDDVQRLRERTRTAIATQLDGHAGLAIISGEDMTALDDAAVADLREFLAMHSTAQQVMAYVRPPRSFMESAFQQRVRGGMGRWNPGSLYPGYHRRFAKFERSFGRANVRYRPFVRACLAQGDVVADFCREAGLPAPASAVMLNQALSRRAVGLLFTYRKFGGTDDIASGDIRDNRALFEALGTLAGPRLRLAGPAVDAVLTRQARDLAWVEARLGMSLAEETAQRAGPEGEVVDTEDDLLRYDAAQVDWLRQWCRHPGLSTGMAADVAAAAMRDAVPVMIEAFRARATAGPAGRSG